MGVVICMCEWAGHDYIFMWGHGYICIWRAEIELKDGQEREKAWYIRRTWQGRKRRCGGGTRKRKSLVHKKGVVGKKEKMWRRVDLPVIEAEPRPPVW